MIETDVDRVVKQHDSDYINGEKDMFVTYSRDDDQPDEYQTNVDGGWNSAQLKAWTEALLGNSPFDKWKREHESELLEERKKIAHLWGGRRY